MNSERVRKNITIKNKNELRKFNDFYHKSGFQSFSHMVQHCLNELMKSPEEQSSKELNEVKNRMDIFQDILLKKFDYLTTRIDLIEMRINESGINSEVAAVMKEIFGFLIDSQMSYSRLRARLRGYDKKTIDSALSLLFDSGLIEASKEEEDINEKEKK